MIGSFISSILSKYLNNSLDFAELEFNSFNSFISAPGENILELPSITIQLIELLLSNSTRDS